MVIQGKAYWAAIKSPNTTFDPDGMWTVDVCNLDEANLNIANKNNLIVKNKGDDRGDFVTLKQYARTKDGSSRAITVKDSERNPFPTNKRIGNGSKVNASYFPKEYTVYGGGVKGYLNAVQVVELVEYNTDDFDVVPGGYVNEGLEEIPFAS